MTEIISRRQIALPPAAVYTAAKQVERFPEVLPDVDRVTVLEHPSDGVVVTKWEGTIRVGPLARGISWTERDVWDDASLSCRFELLEGDMKEYSGTWQFAESPGGCEVTLAVQFELGVPLLGPMINRIVDQIMQKNCDDLLVALEQLAAG